MRRFAAEMARLTCALGATFLVFGLILVPSVGIMADDGGGQVNGGAQLARSETCSPGHCTLEGDCAPYPGTDFCPPDESNCAQADDSACTTCLCQTSPTAGCLCQDAP
jgi:hypothetical protein